MNSVLRDMRKRVKRDCEETESEDCENNKRVVRPPGFEPGFCGALRAHGRPPSYQTRLRPQRSVIEVGFLSFKFFGWVFRELE